MKDFLKEEIKKSPDSPGVYIFRDKDGRVLYVGKAKNLSHRLKSYLSDYLSHKIRKMLDMATSIEIITTDSELDAFILESNLIKTYQPPFNVLLKDDKHYPYIRLDVKDPFPYLEIVRRIKNDGALYYGPYVPTWAVRETLKVITQSFPIRRCRQDLTKSKSKRPCLNFQIKRCLAPCAGKITQEEYRKIVDKVVEILEGRGEYLIEKLEKEMFEASERLEFEKAARLRDQIFSIKRILERQKVLLSERIDMDVLALEKEKEKIALAVLFVRKGMLIGEKVYLLDTQEEEEVFATLLREYYLEVGVVPDVILTDRTEIVSKWLPLILKKKETKIKAPWNTQLKELFRFAKKKAKEKLIESIEKQKSTEFLLRQVQEFLGLKKLPYRIEGYDISSLYGGEAVGSMVVFVNGEPLKSEYRRFKIRNVQGIDDYAMQREVLKRRFEHSEWDWPDLIVMDGGYGHVRSAMKVVEEMGIDVDVVSISKGEKEDELWNINGKINVSPHHPVMHLIQRVRDESHRFAVSYHKKLRKKESFASFLDSIPGVGIRRKEKIMRNVKSFEELSTMSPEELSLKCGIPLYVAKQILENLKH